MKPVKEKHEFYIDIMPEFGFPVSMRPRFQLNIVIGRRVDAGWKVIESMQDQIVLPFLWAQDGFGEPSEQMAEDLKFGLAAPKKLPLAGGVVFFAIGGALVLASLAYGAWRKRRSSTGAANLTNGDCTVVT